MGALQRGLEHPLVEFLLGRRRAHLGGDLEGPIGELRDPDRVDDPFLRRHPAHEDEVVRPAPLERRGVERQPVVDDRPGHVRVDRRLRFADRDEVVRAVGEDVARPRHVEPAMERRDDRRLRARADIGGGARNRALVDGPQALLPQQYAALMEDLRRLAGAVGRTIP